MKEATFGIIDWTIIICYFVGGTWIGGYFKSKQSTSKDFFLGGKTVPWYAVSASIVATTISAISFIGIPAMVFAQNGDFTFFQFAIGAIAAKFILAYKFLPYYYEKDYYGPYDLMADRLAPFVGKLTAGMFFIGAVLGQGVRMYATALVVEIVTGLDLFTSIWIIAAFSIFWTWLGGISAVIWTDFLQFFIFIGGALLAIGFVMTRLPFGAETVIDQASSMGKFNFINFSMDIHNPFTFWAAILAMPFQNLAAYGTDQLNTQRLLCCKTVKESQKALLWSNIGELITLIMMIMGILLAVYYTEFPLIGESLAFIKEKGDRIFPLFITTELPDGIRGLLIAAILATANSSLDSTLAALSQTTISIFSAGYEHWSEKKTLFISRVWIFVWGIALAVMAILCSTSQFNLVNLAFSMTSYTYGPMLGVFLYCFSNQKTSIKSIKVIVPIAILMVVVINLPHKLGLPASGPLMAWPWTYPLSTLVVLFGAKFLGRFLKDEIK